MTGWGSEDTLENQTVDNRKPRRGLLCYAYCNGSQLLYTMNAQILLRYFLVLVLIGILFYFWNDSYSYFEGPIGTAIFFILAFRRRDFFAKPPVQFLAIAVVPFLASVLLGSLCSLFYTNTTASHLYWVTCLRDGEGIFVIMPYFLLITLTPFALISFCVSFYRRHHRV